MSTPQRNINRARQAGTDPETALVFHARSPSMTKRINRHQIERVQQFRVRKLGPTFRFMEHTEHKRKCQGQRTSDQISTPPPPTTLIVTQFQGESVTFLPDCTASARMGSSD